MAVFVSRKKQKLSKKLRDDEIGFFCSFLGKIFQRLPSTIFILAFIYIWSSSATIFSGDIVHLCVSSRKLNNLYCLSAGAHPNLDIPVVNFNSSAGEAAGFGIGSSIPFDNVKKFNPFDNKNATLAVNGTMGYAHGEEVSSAEDANSFDSKNATLAVNRTMGYAHGEVVSSAEDANSFDSKNATLVVNGTMGYAHGEVVSSAEDANSFDSKNATLVVNGTMGYAHGEVVSSAEDANSFDSKNATLAVNRTMGYAHGEVISSAENANSFDSKNATLVVNGTMGYVYGEVVSSVEDSNPFDSKNATLAVNETKEYAYKEVAEPNLSVSLVGSSSSTEEIADFLVRSLTPTDNVEPSNAFDSKISIPAVNETIEHAYRDVEEQIRLQRSWNSGSNHATCDGRGIYVYDLPSKFNKDLTDRCNDVITWPDFCKYMSNDGLGERIEKLGEGWYHTHQYALEPIFHARVLKHPCRVYDREEARLFYVPYYGGFDVLRWHFKNVSSDVKDSLGFDLLRWLETQESWYRNLGKDHVFVLGKISWDFRRNEWDPWGTRFLELDEMQNPVKLLIERHPWHINDVGVPHPTYFHPHSDEEIVSWQLKMSRSSRRNVVGFAGAARPGSSESIRSILIEQCTSTNSGECRFLNCISGQCDRPELIVELFAESEFCLQPTGDSPTRKSVFDSLISGCIPVLFDPMTAYYQYPWHLPEDRHKYSVFIDKEEVRNKSVNVVERLRKIPLREREDMRRYIVNELLPGLVYGDRNSKLNKFRDAFSITIDSLLEKVSRLNNG